MLYYKRNLIFCIYMLNNLEMKTHAWDLLPNNTRVEVDAGLDETKIVCKFFTIEAG